MIYLLTLVVVVGVLTLAGYGVVGYFNNSRSDHRTALVAERKKNAVATKTLRQIASGASGLPVLDAQNALDEIERLEIKELH